MEQGGLAVSLFPEPTTAEKIASVDKLRQDAREKVMAASRMNDQRIRDYWLAEWQRLDRLRCAVVNSSQQELSL